MIKYDSESLYNRALERLQQNPDWEAISSDSVIESLLKTNAEMNAETVRYGEYLFNESKWDSAQNRSSIVAMAGMLGYKPKRAKSATGSIYISSDSRIHSVGKTISKENFLNLGGRNDSLGSTWSTPTSSIAIDPTWSVVDSDGNNYIIANADVFNAGSFYKGNILLIEGSRETFRLTKNVIKNTATKTKLKPTLYVPFTILNMEEGDTSSTEKFLTIKEYSKSGALTREYRIVENLLLSSSGDTDVEILPDTKVDNLSYLVFNNSAQYGTSPDLSDSSNFGYIEISYIKTRGLKGNNPAIFRDFTLTSPDGNTVLYGTNFSAMIGGSDIELVADIKENAPKYYINNYSVGTKEAYENIIKGITFTFPGGSSKPKRVRVYPGEQYNEKTNTYNRVTKVTFLADHLEDIATSSDGVEGDNEYKDIEDTLNYYLYKIKSPQDIIKFEAPRYVGFSVGLKCSADRSKVESVSSLIEGIRSLIDSGYGPNSSQLDFSRNFYLADVLAGVKTSYPEILSIKAEIEACTKINWDRAERELPRKQEGPSDAVAIHTLRMPFDFSSVFKGNNYIQGFKDYETGSSYVLRFDIFYKKALNSTSKDYHISLFIPEGASFTTNGVRNSKAFYVVKDNDASSSKTWENINSDRPYPAGLRVDGSGDPCQRITKAYQYYLKEKIYTDDEFEELRVLTDNNIESSIEDSSINLGALDNYLIYFSGSYDNNDGEIGSGYIEVTVDSFYKVLTKLAEQDDELASQLAECPLANIKCNAANDAFDKFREILASRVDIYVSARPTDIDILIDEDDENECNVVLYIDSSDSDSVDNTANLTTVKRPRMISVDCSLA